MAENVTAEEIAELVEFVREEASELEVDFCDIPDAVSRAQRLCAIAEKLPALLETLKTAEPSAEAIKHGAMAFFHNWQNANAGEEETYKAETRRVLLAAYAIDVAPLIAERDAAMRDSAAFEKMFKENPSASWSRLNKTESSLAAARETIAKLREAISGLRCDVTRNLVGTDTQMVGGGCKCAPCQCFRAALAQLDAAPTPGHTDLMISPEAIDEALAANPLPEELANPGEDSRLAQAERTIAEAVEIMRPFAESAATYGGYLDEDDCDNAGTITVTSLSAARAFVEKHGGAK
jgi:hypothetical protein